MLSAKLVLPSFRWDRSKPKAVLPSFDDVFCTKGMPLSVTSEPRLVSLGSDDSMARDSQQRVCS